MKYKITQSKLFEVMSKFMDEMVPDLELPLKKKSYHGVGNSGYGSGLDDYHYFTTYYMDKWGNNWFVNYDCRRNDYHWEVSDELEPLYDTFGEKSFILFIKWKFDIELDEKCQCKYDWSITDLGESDDDLDESISDSKSYSVIKESNIPLSVLRRTNLNLFKQYLNDGIQNYPMLCDDFDEDYEYSDAVITYAVDNLLYDIDDDIEEKNYYTDVLDFLTREFIKHFEDELINDYNFTCIENQ